MNESERKALKAVYGEWGIPVLQREICNIILEQGGSFWAAMDQAEAIYNHLAENVIRQSDLLNYEMYDSLNKETNEPS